MVQGAQPEFQDHALVRSEEIVVLHDQVVVDDTTPRNSAGLQVGPFRHFALYLRVKSTGTDDHVVQVIVQFLEPRSGLWHDYLQGLFASLHFEDVVHATERQYVFHGDCLGRELRVQLVGTTITSGSQTPTSSLYYTVSAAVELYV